MSLAGCGYSRGVVWGTFRGTIATNRWPMRSTRAHQLPRSEATRPLRGADLCCARSFVRARYRPLLGELSTSSISSLASFGHWLFPAVTKTLAPSLQWCRGPERSFLGTAHPIWRFKGRNGLRRTSWTLDEAHFCGCSACHSRSSCCSRSSGITSVNTPQQERRGAPRSAARSTMVIAHARGCEIGFGVPRKEISRIQMVRSHGTGR